jgi:hypothetical protein
MRTLLTLAACTAAMFATAQASDYKQFRDWLVACDNLRDCTAFGFDVELSGGSYLRLARDGAQDAPVTVTITTDVPEDATVTFRFDDPNLPGLPAGAQAGERTDAGTYRRFAVPVSDALIDSLRRAKTIAVTRSDPPGQKLKDDERTSSISLSGAVAALLWIDEQQKRLDTRTALVRRGPKPASAVAPQPAAPMIVAAKPTTARPPKASADLVARARKACDGDANARGEEADALAPSLFLYSFSCPELSGAYNMHSVWFVVPAGQPQAVRQVSFRWPVRIGDTVQDPDAGSTAVNSSFDPKIMAIDIFNKGRGIGDCGTEENWVFDGKAFRLALIKLMPDCRGVLPEDWPTLYRAVVKR